MRSLGRVTASVFAAAAVVGVAAPALAAPAYPRAVGRCVDQTEVLGRALCAKVTAVLLREEKSASDEIAVAVVPTTGDSSIEAWSTGLFNAWGVGKKWKNNGVLLVVAVDDHKVRLETGRGVADRLSDSDAATILDDVTSHFTSDGFALGILTGPDDVRRQLGHTVPAAALLAPLAATAPATDPTGDAGSDPGSDDLDVAAGGSEFTSPDDFASVDDDGDSPVLPIALGGFAVVALLAVAIGRASSGSAGRSSASYGHRAPTRQATWMSAGTDSSPTSSSSGFDSSGSSGSSFGGGSSDGGGSTSSW